MVKIAKKLSLQRRQAEEGICERHREPLELFCPTDEILICRVCGRSEEHGSHEAIPADEAAQDYKDKIFNCLETLKTKKENILVYIEEVGDKSREMLVSATIAGK
ncbi:PREDICTED: E3 ubiquitin-protein ligase TRIM39-like [Gekko japonicus]|uniref:E3 ubiquitin-protein ligase TRIM39-like n=1 Tax=Gekko japonicus TaxID=146911 RepID=A0ABM1L1X9_GEKJA|nr:PREDICTED: E3 ubiquitin-protein ligase TRIM39-like [Gekko japonicus]